MIKLKRTLKIRQSFFALLTCAILLLSGFDGKLWAGDGQRMVIRGNAIELTVSGSLTRIEDVSEVLAALQGQFFLATTSGIIGVGLESGYSHRRDLDTFQLQGLATWQRMPVGRNYHGFAGIGGGWRQEWLGSFRQARYPLGFDAGLRLMPSLKSSLKVFYRFRRIFGDPQQNFNEHRLVISLGILLGNG